MREEGGRKGKSRGGSASQERRHIEKEIGTLQCAVSFQEKEMDNAAAMGDMMA